MKSPADLAGTLLNQWSRGELREQRMMGDPGSFPIEMSIGAPQPGLLRRDPGLVGDHLTRWRQVATGTVEWRELRTRALAEPVEVPVKWTLASADEWLSAVVDLAPEARGAKVDMADKVTAMAQEFARFRQLLSVAPPRFHRRLLRNRALVTATNADDLNVLVHLAAQLQPGQAAGVPLRAMPVAGADTKFFERNGTLLTVLLDERFDGQVSASGLDRFLGAAEPEGHWLLVIDLDGCLLGYRTQRLTDRTIAADGLPGSHLLVVENERCAHALPPMSDTIAVLGAGLNLGWLAGADPARQAITYWGDVDTWGLSMLAAARQIQPTVRPILMDLTTFETYQNFAVAERQLAQRPETGLTPADYRLFDYLASLDCGRLEQERIPSDHISSILLDGSDESDPTGT